MDKKIRSLERQSIDNPEALKQLERERCRAGQCCSHKNGHVIPPNIPIAVTQTLIDTNEFDRSIRIQIHISAIAYDREKSQEIYDFFMKLDNIRTLG